MLQSSELMLLITLNDTVSTSETKIPDHLMNTVQGLLDRGLIKITKGIVYPSKKGKLLVKTAKSENNFRRILPMMNFRMIANLWHRLVEYCMNSGFHLNVVLKNLEDDALEYIELEVNMAKEKRRVMKDIVEISLTENTNEDAENYRDSHDVCEELLETS